MKASTGYLLGAFGFLLAAAYLLLSPASEWHWVVAVGMTLAAGVMYTVQWVRERRRERADEAPGSG